MHFTFMSIEPTNVIYNCLQTVNIAYSLFSFYKGATMKVFVTGSTGFLGSNLVRALLERGYEVKALARNKHKAQKVLENLKLEIVEGDLENVPAFASALTDCDMLIHTAAYFREYYGPGNHWQTLEKLNVSATIELLAAAESHGIKRVIHTSSSGVIGMKANHQPGDENTPPDAKRLENLYFKSKLKADQAITEFLKQSKLEVITVFPGWMHGPGDAAPTAAGQVVLDLLNRAIPAYPDGGTTVVDVRDVANGMILALEQGKNLDRFILAGKYMSLQEIGASIEQVSGVPTPKHVLPASLVLLIAWFSERISSITKQPSSMTVEGVKTLLPKDIASSDKAIRELGITFRNFDETAKDAVNWFRNSGQFKLKS
jgi:dihydroflavonol-4-reductase